MLDFDGNLDLCVCVTSVGQILDTNKVNYGISTPQPFLGWTLFSGTRVLLRLRGGLLLLNIHNFRLGRD